MACRGGRSSALPVCGVPTFLPTSLPHHRDRGPWGDTWDVPSQETLFGEQSKQTYALTSCIHHPAAFKISVLYYYYYCYYLYFFLSKGPNPCQAQRVLSSQGDLISFKAENGHLSSTKENLQEFICQQGRFHLISAQFEITLVLQLFIS